MGGGLPPVPTHTHARPSASLPRLPSCSSRPPPPRQCAVMEAVSALRIGEHPFCPAAKAPHVTSCRAALLCRTADVRSTPLPTPCLLAAELYNELQGLPEALRSDFPDLAVDFLATVFRPATAVSPAKQSQQQRCALAGASEAVRPHGAIARLNSNAHRRGK